MTIYLELYFQLQKQHCCRKSNYMQYNLYLVRNYLAPNNSEIFRFSPNSEKMVNFQQGGLLDVVTKWKVMMTDKYNFTVANTYKL